MPTGISAEYDGETAPAPTDSRWRALVSLLALGTFAVGTDGFVIAGVLPAIADSLQVGIGAAGQLVTVFALAYAIAAPIVGMLTAGWSRRTTLLVALATLIVGNAMTALAPGYGWVLASRTVAAVGAALYTATATAAAAMIAGEARRGRAIAMVMLGLTVALALGAPMGTALSAILDWRSTLWFVSALALLAAVAIAVRFPALRAAGDLVTVRDRLAPLADRRVLGALARAFVAFVGIYLPYTYLSAVYAPATGDDGGRIALLLLVFGLAGTAGNLVAGNLVDRMDPRRVIVGGTSLLALAFVVVPLLRDSMTTALVATVICGALSFSVTTPQQHELIALRPAATSVLTSLYQSAVYLAISASGVVGAFALDVVGPAMLAPVAALFTLGAAFLTGLTWYRSRAVRT